MRRASPRPPGKRVPVALAVAACCLAGPVLAAGGATSAASPCPEAGAVVAVDTGEGKLRLCDGGRAVAAYDVALGTEGTGKNRQGDNKTPLGTYALGAPRASAKFHVFIPIAYPTAAQRAKGFTGSAIGIHGPARWSRWAGALNTAVDWTRGCIAVGTDAEIDRIAAWARDKRVRTVRIR